MSGRLTFNRLVTILAEERDEAAEEVEPTIDREKAERALAAPFGDSDEYVFYSDPIREAGLCAVVFIRLRPLSRDNKRVAYKCMQEMLVRYPWAQFEADPRKIAEMLDGVEAGTIDGEEFVEWVRAEAGMVAWLRYQQRGP